MAANCQHRWRLWPGLLVCLVLLTGATQRDTLPTCATCDLRPRLNTSGRAANNPGQPLAQPTTTIPRPATATPTPRPAPDVSQLGQSAFWTVLCLAALMAGAAIFVAFVVRGRMLRR